MKENECVEGEGGGKCVCVGRTKGGWGVGWTLYRRCGAFVLTLSESRILPSNNVMSDRLSPFCSFRYVFRFESLLEHLNLNR